MELIVSLIAGAVGGNIAGMAVNRINQGTLINSLAGIVRIAVGLAPGPKRTAGAE